MDARQQEQFARLKKQAEAYRGRDQAELLRALDAEVRKGKQAGTLDNAMLERFRQTVGPALDPEQRRRMETLIGELKRK